MLDDVVRSAEPARRLRLRAEPKAPVGVDASNRPLVRAILDTVQVAFGARSRARRWLMTALFGLAAIRLAQRGLAFEQAIAEDGDLQRAASDLLRCYAGAVRVDGADRIPARGPLLIVCNHAGMGDALGVLASVARPDLAVLVQKRGLLTALPVFAERCIAVDLARPAAGLRRALRHLRGGGALLMFPAGRIEPDPRLDLPAALCSLGDWTESASFLAGATPGLRLLPAAVGGLVSERALRRFSHDGRAREDRAFAAATLQLLAPGFRDTRVAVAFGAPIPGDGAARDAITRQMRGLIARVARRDLPENPRRSRRP